RRTGTGACVTEVMDWGNGRRYFSCEMRGFSAGKLLPLASRHPCIDFNQIGDRSLREGCTLQVAIGAKLRRHRADRDTALRLGLPDHPPPSFMSLQCRLIFRRRGMRHLWALI